MDGTEFAERYRLLFTRKHGMTVVRDEVLVAIAVARIARRICTATAPLSENNDRESK